MWLAMKTKSNIMTPTKVYNPSETPFSRAVAKAKKEYKPDSKPQTLPEKVAHKQAEPYTPMLITANATPEEMELLSTKLRVAALRVLDEAIQRGKFTFHDVESVTAAMAAEVLRPGADKEGFRVSAAVGAHLDRLIKLIQARETVEMNAETVDRIRVIEDALMELSE